MSRLEPIALASADAKSQPIFAALNAKLGFVPNMARVLAYSPAALDGYAKLNGALAGGSLNAKVREQLALAIAEANLCGYCLSAHSAIGAKVGLTTAEILAARQGGAPDPKSDALVKFARTVVLQKGEVSDATLAQVRAAGASDGEIVEVVANVALNLLTNYVNHVARTPIDFPAVNPGS
ncbi:MAG: carboxymuconolactone decarboxylase family protein [Planctomycetes bacterium]|nr:carboxymuconolactone decarboxylase family protein [Planctomycetota bacterium]